MNKNDIGKGKRSYNRLLGGKSALVTALILVVVLIIFSSINFEISIEFGVIASIFTFIYGFFFSSLLSMVRNKYLESKRSFSQIASDIFVLNQLAILSNQKSFQKSMKKSLKNFVNDLTKIHPQNYEQMDNHISNLYKVAKKFKINEIQEREGVQRRLLDTLRNISFAREKLEVFGDRYIKGETKFILFSSTLALIAIIFLVTHQNIWLFVMGVLLIVLVVYVVSLIIDLDNISYGTKRIRTENLKELEESMD